MVIWVEWRFQVITAGTKPDKAVKTYWEEYLGKNPSKYQEITLARTLVLNMARKSYAASEDRIESAWKNIDRATREPDTDTFDRKVVPLNSFGTLKKQEREYRIYSQNHQFFRIAGILIFAFALAIVANIIQPQEQELVVEAPIVYEEHYVPPGVKSTLTLQDGSKVILNSGSSLRYIKNFKADQRELELVGEAYFEVAQDPNRPFKVITGSITTKALGTAFNIKAYKNDAMDISLLTGSVEVDFQMEQAEKVRLVPGQSLKINLEKQEFQKYEMDEDKLLAWTSKTIVFERTPMIEIIRVLENWYGVKINLANSPRMDLELSGKFHDQTLKNVLEGLSYSARFEFNVNKDQVTLVFKVNLK